MVWRRECGIHWSCGRARGCRNFKVWFYQLCQDDRRGWCGGCLGNTAFIGAWKWTNLVARRNLCRWLCDWYRVWFCNPHTWNRPCPWIKASLWRWEPVKWEFRQNDVLVDVIYRCSECILWKRLRHFPNPNGFGYSGNSVFVRREWIQLWRHNLYFWRLDPIC